MATQPRARSKTRDSRVMRKPPAAPESGKRWAVIVGISHYRHAERWKIDYADDDARALHDFLLTPEGGGYAGDRVRFLVNEQATYEAMRDALFTFLKEPAPEDVVLIYFACHGTPDPDLPENVYLLAHDTRPENIAATALPMDDVDRALKRTLRAGRAVIIADTCHSAAIASTMGRTAADRAEKVNAALKVLQPGGAQGVALLTSAQRSETATEGAEWGGHGVFTHFLLEGLKGDADRKPHGNEDGQVGIQELFEFVRARVTEETKVQHPFIGPEYFDPRFPMAFTGGPKARERYELGCLLAELGQLWDDAGRWESAVARFDEAIGLSPQPMPQAFLARGRARMALGYYPEAARDFRESAKDPELRDSLLYLGIVCAKQGEVEQALAALDRWGEQASDDERALWIRQLVACLSRPKEGKRRALLIGIGEYPQGQRWWRRGPPNDVRAMRNILVGSLGFNPDDVKELIDADATRDGILRELEALGAGAERGDTVLIYFSGHAFRGQESARYLGTYDMKREWQTIANSISAEELDERLRAIGAMSVLVLLDTTTTDRLVELAAGQSSYTLLAATVPDGDAYEIPSGADRSGAFTTALVQGLSALGSDISATDLMDDVVRSLSGLPTPQTPLLAGNQSRPLFPSSTDMLLAAFDSSQRRQWRAFGLPEVRRQYAAVRGKAAFPELHYSFGRALLAKGDQAGAIAALKAALAGRAGPYPEAELALGIALLRSQRHADAYVALRAHADHAEAHREALMEPMTVLERTQLWHPHALMVGIDEYRGHALKGAVSDVRALGSALAQRGFRVEYLTNRDATADAVMEALKGLAEGARWGPALFYFAGAGTLRSPITEYVDQSGHVARIDLRDLGGAGTAGPENVPAIVCADRVGEAAPIDLGVLASVVGDGPTNLVAIFDAGWAPGVALPWGAPWGSRYIPEEHLEGEGTAESSMARGAVTGVPGGAESPAREAVRAWVAPRRVGRLSIFGVSIQAAAGYGRPDGTDAVVEAEFPALDGSGGRAVHGALTHSLVSILQETAPSEMTYRDLEGKLAAGLQWLSPYIAGTDLDEKLFSNRVLEDQAHALIEERIGREPVRRVIPMLEALVAESDGRDAAAQLDLGVAYAALEDYERSEAALAAAKVAGGPRLYEACYYLGYVLLRGTENLDGAADVLKHAIELKKGFAPAYYYLGEAIRRRVERQAEELTDADEAFATYLQLGAPLGRRDEVEAFRRWRASTRFGTGTGTGTGS